MSGMLKTQSEMANICLIYCMEGTERRLLVFRSAYIYCQNINNLKCTLALFLYANGKKGKQANSERDKERERVCVRESERCRKDGLGVRHKTSRWKNPVKSFWDKLGRINFS
jgi:hypothetical protein